MAVAALFGYGREALRAFGFFILTTHWWYYYKNKAEISQFYGTSKRKIKSVQFPSLNWDSEAFLILSPFATYIVLKWKILYNKKKYILKEAKKKYSCKGKGRDKKRDKESIN